MVLNKKMDYFLQEKKKKKNSDVAQQRVYLTKKEGIFLILLPNKVILLKLFWISRLSELKIFGPMTINGFWQKPKMP